ncbi:DEAD/DEAH box helicase, partial [bacterium]|nr:DEAD/DEAH box helicase [bacterium]
MDTAAFLQRLLLDRRASDQMCRVQDLPERPARYADIPLDPRVQAALHARGIERLYTHQADAIRHVRDGKSVVVVTGTASGKTLCYHVPILETLLADPMATALAIYPTKALAQDQFRGLTSLAEPIDGLKLLCGPYDGDTPQPQRRKLRNAGSV